MTIKDILTEHRITIIGAISWAYETSNEELIREKMFDFFHYCKAYENKILPIVDKKERVQLLRQMVKDMKGLIGNDFGLRKG